MNDALATIKEKQKEIDKLKWEREELKKKLEKVEQAGESERFY